MNRATFKRLGATKDGLPTVDCITPEGNRRELPVDPACVISQSGDAADAIGCQPDEVKAARAAALVATLGDLQAGDVLYYSGVPCMRLHAVR